MLNSKTNRIALYVSAFLVIALVLFAILRDNADQITLREANGLLSSAKIKSIVATEEYIYIKTDEDVFKVASSQVTPSMFRDHKVEVGSSGNVVVYILFFILIVGFGSLAFRWWQKREGADFLTASTNAPKNTLGDMNSAVVATKSDVSFSDIGGISDVKIELEEIIDFMKNSKRYKNFGARMPRGVLLVGPPGVGKTMIAKAVAHEAGVPFYYQSGASFVQIYVGMGAKEYMNFLLLQKTTHLRLYLSTR